MEGPPTSAALPKELRIYGHSAIFYWWPVWAFGFLLAFITWLNGSTVAVIPAHSTYASGSKTIDLHAPLDPSQQRLVRDKDHKDAHQFYIHMHPSKNLGVFYAIVVLVVIFITNFPLRGLSSALAVAFIVVIALLFAVLDIWDKILGAFGSLAVFNNMGYYFFLSSTLFVIWVLVTFVFDRFHYWRVTPGQITHEYVFGGGQKSFETEGMVIEKRRDDMFRHWVLGLGSGDIIMYPMQSAGTTRDEMDIHNVLFVGYKLRQIQQLISVRTE
jgi:hypothetical protein